MIEGNASQTDQDMSADVDEAIDRGTAFLRAQQLPSGQFPIQATLHDQQVIKQDQSLFATTQIVYSLGFVPGAASEAMIEGALGYFKREMTGQGLWRYWTRDAVWAGRRIHHFIPADLDDTASVSYLLQRHGAIFPDNRPLLLLNRNRAGLFYTWLMLRPKATFQRRYWLSMLRELSLPRMTAFWRTTEAGYLDVDGVVNANALLYLGSRPETKAATDWLIEIVHAGREAVCDKWYRDALSFYYALSRSYRAGVRALGAATSLIVERLRAAAAPSGQIGTGALTTALAVCTLQNLDAPARDLIENGAMWLLTTQAPDGSWPSAPYYFGGPKKAVSWGSTELTTGIALEALARCRLLLSDRVSLQGGRDREEVCVA